MASLMPVVSSSSTTALPMRFDEACVFLSKKTLCEGVIRGEPVRRLTFQVPKGAKMNVQTALRQVVLVNVQNVSRMYSPIAERPDGTFDLVVRIYQGRTHD